VGALSEILLGHLPILKLFLQKCILTLVEILEVAIKHRLVFTDPFALLRNLWFSLILLYHGIEEVSFQPIGGIPVEPLLDR
jgi:hypothetical protein